MIRILYLDHILALARVDMAPVETLVGHSVESFPRSYGRVPVRMFSGDAQGHYLHSGFCRLADGSVYGVLVQIEIYQGRWSCGPYLRAYRGDVLPDADTRRRLETAGVGSYFPRHPETIVPGIWMDVRQNDSPFNPFASGG
jgi:hypothetical protein